MVQCHHTYLGVSLSIGPHLLLQFLWLHSGKQMEGIGLGHGESLGGRCVVLDWHLVHTSVGVHLNRTLVGCLAILGGCCEGVLLWVQTHGVHWQFRFVVVVPGCGESSLVRGPLVLT